jgi:hypothetical protein
VLVGSGQSLDGWVTHAEAALANVRQGLPDGLAPSWNGRAVLEVPATQRDFESVLGKPRGTYTGIAAVTHRAGIGDGPLRIVMNPRTAELSPSSLQSVLEHELVHVATGSPDAPTPMWAEEGLAEWVSLRSSSDERSEGTDEVLERVRDEGAPRSFPADRRFQVAERDLQEAYAEAWLACRFIADQYSEVQLGRLYAELHQGASLDEASRSVLRISEEDLTAGWRDYLVRLARY